jgi:hypothetical protein
MEHLGHPPTEGRRILELILDRDWIHLPQDNVEWQEIENSAMKFPVS